MNPTTESRLMPLVKSGNGTAIGELIEQHHRMVFYVAGQYRNGGSKDEFDELVSVGELALCDSVPRFKGYGTCAFSTHAMFAIRRAIVQYQRTQGGTKPEWETRKTQKVDYQLNLLSQQLCRTPTYDEFEDVFGKAAARAWADSDNPHDPPIGTLSYTDRPLLQTTTGPHPIVSPDSFPTASLHAKFLLDELTTGTTLGQLVNELSLSRQDILEEVWEFVE